VNPIARESTIPLIHPSKREPRHLTSLLHDLRQHYHHGQLVATRAPTPLESKSPLRLCSPSFQGLLASSHWSGRFGMTLYSWITRLAAALHQTCSSLTGMFDVRYIVDCPIMGLVYVFHDFSREIALALL
jgi:hypothetical protein